MKKWLLAVKSIGWNLFMCTTAQSSCL